MEERVKFLESELQRYAESFEELTYHYSTIHNFLLQHFGATFKSFVLGDNVDKVDVANGEDSEQQQGTHEDQDGGDDNVDENEEYLNDGDEEGEDYDGEVKVEHEGTDEINSDSYLEDDQVSTVQEHRIRVAPVLKYQASSRNGSNQSQGGMGQQNALQNSKASGSHQPRPSSSGLGSAKMLPPLLQRPGTSSSQFHRNFQQGVKTVRRSPYIPPTVTIKPVVGGNRGNEVLLSNDDEDFKAGKYSKFYSKVNDELIQCKMCHKILKRRGKFIQHLRTHTGEKPYQCRFCPAAFSRKDNMNVHVSKHHSPEGVQNGGQNRTLSMQMQQYRYATNSTSSNSAYAFKCQLCSKPFPNEKIYQIHMRLVHPPEDGNEDEDIDYYEDQDQDVEEAEPMEMLDMEGQDYASYEDDERNYLADGDEDEDSMPNLATISY